MDNSRDLLFVSYAWEDGAAAEWLTLKLTALGYRVWCDRFENLGGESWPTEIDDAIRNRTFRLLHLVSRHSLAKANPIKERELALAIGRERGIKDFLIPLNLDGTTPGDLGWRLIDITFIPFEDWAAGLKQLLKKLERIGAPRPLADRGRSIALDAVQRRSPVVDEPERLYSNCLPFLQVPPAVYRYKFSRPVYSSDEVALRDSWACRRVDDRHALAFGPPHQLPRALTVRQAASWLWSANPRIDGIDAGDLVAELLRKSVQVEMLRRGLRWTPDGRALFFPAGLLEKDKIRFTTYKGRRTNVKVGGKRTWGEASVSFRLGFSSWVRRDVIPGFALLLRLRLLLLDPEGKPVTSTPSLRRLVAGNWLNHQFLSRFLAIASFMAEEGPQIGIPVAEAGSIKLSASYIGGLVPRRIDERLLSDSGGTAEDLVEGGEDESGGEEA